MPIALALVIKTTRQLSLKYSTINRSKERTVTSFLCLAHAMQKCNWLGSPAILLEQTSLRPAFMTPTNRAICDETNPLNYSMTLQTQHSKKLQLLTAKCPSSKNS